MSYHFNGRRTATPVSNRLRAVAYRHQRHIPSHHGSEAVRTQDHISSEVKEPAAGATLHFIEADGPTDAEAEYAESGTSFYERMKERAEAGKASKDAAREDLARRRLREPKSGFLETLLHPSLAMEKAARTNEITMSRGSIVFLDMVKWYLLGTALAVQMASFVNRSSYSFVRINFTNGAWIALRIAVFAFVMDWLSNRITGLAGKFFDRHFSAAKVSALRARYALLEILGFVVSALLLKLNLIPGTACFLIVIITGMLLRFHASQLVCRFSTRAQLTIISVNVLITVLLGFAWYELAFADVQRIFGALFNL